MNVKCIKSIVKNGVEYATVGVIYLLNPYNKKNYISDNYGDKLYITKDKLKNHFVNV